jgi:hypothetical protein
MNTIADSSDPGANVVAVANRYATASAAHKKAVIRVVAAKAALEAVTKAEVRAAEENECVRQEFVDLL